jgi:hypothetical protein
MSFEECLQILGLERNYTDEQLKSAYRNSALIWHPDRFQNQNEELRARAAKEMQRVNEAFQTLKSGRASASSSNFSTHQNRKAAPPPPPPPPHKDPPPATPPPAADTKKNGKRRELIYRSAQLGFILLSLVGIVLLRSYIGSTTKDVSLPTTMSTNRSAPTSNAQQSILTSNRDSIPAASSASDPLLTLDLEKILDTSLFREIYGYQIRKIFIPRSDSDNGRWQVEIWKGSDSILTVSDIENESPEFTRMGLAPLLGTKDSQLIVEQYTGGSHCCQPYTIVRLLPQPAILFSCAKNDLLGFVFKVIDLNGDGCFEIEDNSRCFEDWSDKNGFSGYAQPYPRLIYEYSSTQKKFVPANQKFPAEFDHLMLPLKNSVDSMNQILMRSTDTLDDTSYYRSRFTEIFAMYAASGRTQQGWDYLNRNYRIWDRTRFTIWLSKIIEGCAAYHTTSRFDPSM